MSLVRVDQGDIVSVVVKSWYSEKARAQHTYKGLSLRTVRVCNDRLMGLTCQVMFAALRQDSTARNPYNRRHTRSHDEKY